MSIDLHRNGKTSFYTNHIRSAKLYNIYRGIQEDTGEYREIQENTGEYRGIQGNEGESRRTQGYPRKHRGMNTREYKGILGNYGEVLDTL